MEKVCFVKVVVEIGCKMKDDAVCKGWDVLRKRMG